MNNEKMFEFALRNKVRFTFKGQISTEDLWDLSVQNLDTIFKSLNSQLKQAKEESLLATKTKEDETLDTMIEIVKYIVSVKLEEKKAITEAQEKRQKKQKLMELIEAKKETDLQGKSVEELQAMLNELD